VNLTRTIRWKLVVFAVISVIAVAVVGVLYAQLPQQAGIGRYAVTVDMTSAGGLYPNANVTYRGSVVGRVTAVEATDTGARARLSISSDAHIAADLDATIAPMSAVGEMYVALDPRSGADPHRDLTDGAVIGADRVRLPTPVSDAVAQVQSLLASVDATNLRVVIDESFTALNGQGPALRSLVDSVSDIMAEAADTITPTATVIDRLGPVLDSQVDSADAIGAWAASLARVTGSLAGSDAALRGVLARAPGAASEATALFDDVAPTVGILLANLTTVEQVLAVYNPALEQVLVLYPPLIAATQGTGLVNADDPGQNTFFAAAGLNDPPPCITGFLDPSQRRSPADLSPAPAPKNLYCKVDPSDPRSVRGARNLPCLEYPGYRAATVTLCRQLAGGRAPRTPTAPVVAPASDAVSAPRPVVAARQYDPRRGEFVADDARVTRVTGVSAHGPIPLRDLLVPPA
jgi:phospholipid/cholesterol/gamma-HCH transport system substrate-binding protein